MYLHHGLECCLVDVGNARSGEWQTQYGAAFDAALDRELQQSPPDLVVALDPGPQDARRLRRIRSKGVKVAASVSRTGGLDASLCDTSLCDALFCHTNWLARQLRDSGAQAPVVLPPPVPADEVSPQKQEQVCVLFPPPSRENGLYFLLRLAEQLSLADADCPILVMSSATAESAGRNFINAGRAAGFDLSQYENILMADAGSLPGEIWSTAQVFVAPAPGRPPLTLIAESLVNGIPTVFSDRMAGEEALAGMSLSLPLPLDYTAETRAPLSAVAVESWVDAIIQLTTNADVHSAESEKARAAGRTFEPAALADRYAAFFEAVVDGQVTDEPRNE
jgi:hypothetical protein